MKYLIQIKSIIDTVNEAIFFIIECIPILIIISFFLRWFFRSSLLIKLKYLFKPFNNDWVNSLEGKYYENRELMTRLYNYIKPKKPKETDYAFLINGGWGSGKTYLTRKFFNEFKKNNRNAIVLNINVHGMQTIKALEASLLNEYLKHFSGISLPLRIRNLIWIKLIDVIDIKNYLCRKPCLPTTVLIVDNIERLSESLPIHVVFGYFEDMLHKNIKVIFIGNEDEIKTREANFTKATHSHPSPSYELIKEKTIGTTYCMQSNQESLFANYSNNTNELKILKNVSEWLNNTNLRLQKRCLDELLALAEGLKNTDFMKDHELKEAFFKHYMAIYLQFHTGAIREEDIEGALYATNCSLSYKEYVDQHKEHKEYVDPRALIENSFKKKYAKDSLEILLVHNNVREKFVKIMSVLIVKSHHISEIEKDFNFIHNEMKNTIRILIDRLRYTLTAPFHNKTNDRDRINTESKFTQLIEAIFTKLESDSEWHYIDLRDFFGILIESESRWMGCKKKILTYIERLETIKNKNTDKIQLSNKNFLFNDEGFNNRKKYDFLNSIKQSYTRNINNNIVACKSIADLHRCIFKIPAAVNDTFNNENTLKVLSDLIYIAIDNDPEGLANFLNELFRLGNGLSFSTDDTTFKNQLIEYLNQKIKNEVNILKKIHLNNVINRIKSGQTD